MPAGVTGARVTLLVTWLVATTTTPDAAGLTVPAIVPLFCAEAPANASSRNRTVTIARAIAHRACEAMKLADIIRVVRLVAHTRFAINEFLAVLAMQEN